MITEPQVLAAAADLLESAGWTQSAYRQDGALCVVGAVRAACHGDPYRPSSRTGDALRLLERRLGVDNIVAWNDAPDRTCEDVTRALRGDVDRVAGETRGTVTP
jgi:hypothetical protein